MCGHYKSVQTKKYYDKPRTACGACRVNNKVLECCLMSEICRQKRLIDLKLPFVNGLKRTTEFVFKGEMKTNVCNVLKGGKINKTALSVTQSL